ncbi:MAG: SMC-Scp complex subunit ScpB [Candidatus Anstonellales archaeon]
MQEEQLIEGALFLSGKPIKLEKIQKFIGIASPGYIKGVIERINAKYASIGSPFEFRVVGDEVYMMVREDVLAKVKEFAKERELSRSALKSLAFISKRDGVEKSKLIRTLGTHMYGAVKELVEKGFVREKKAGRSSQLFVTEKFKDYFGVQEKA